MAEQSKLEQVRETAVSRAKDIFVDELEKRGIHQVTALTAAEGVTWSLDSRARVIPFTKEVRGLGWSDRAIRYFANVYHRYHEDTLGGETIKYLGKPPENEMKAEGEALRSQEHAEARERAQRVKDMLAGHARDHELAKIRAEGSPDERHRRLVSDWF
jgi:hypothetical protein